MGFAALLGKSLVPFVLRHARESVSDELRGLASDPNTASLFSSPTVSGQTVTPDTARRDAAVFSCVQVIADTIATVPLRVYRKSGRAREQAEDHPLAPLLRDAPNAYQTSVEWRAAAQSHLCYRGNSYSRIFRNNSGQVARLIPINPDTVSVKISAGALLYEGDDFEGERFRLWGSEVLHLRGLSGDGVTGYSPIRECRETVGLSLAALEHGATFFGNGTNLGGAIEFPAGTRPEDAKKYLSKFESEHKGSGNSHKVAGLLGGIKYHQIGLSNVDAEFIESRKFSRSEIAGIFRVPPHMIGDLERATFTNIEHQSISFVRDCIRPWAEKWEARLNHVLLSDAERAAGYYIKFSLDGLMRGDMASRYSAYAIGRQWGWLSADDALEKEDSPPLPNGIGQKYLTPMNMVDASSPSAAAVKNGKDSPDAN